MSISPVIILEGPDGAGKTTLAAKLVELMEPQPVRRTNFGPFLGETSIAWRYRRELLRALRRPNEITIFDRSWLAEPIYGTAARGGVSRISTAERRMLERMAWALGAVVVLCLPPRDRCHVAWASRPRDEYLKKKQQLDLVYDLYDAIDYHSCDLPVMRYDYTVDSPVSLLAQYTEVAAPRSYGPGLGRFSPEVALLIGERSGSDQILDLPFVSDHRGGCSAWLADQLEEWGVRERDLYWVNAFTPGDFAPTDGDFIAELDPRVIIAMGEQAAGWANDLGVSHKSVPHPQFWKRFRYHEPYPLRGAIR